MKALLVLLSVVVSGSVFASVGVAVQDVPVLSAKNATVLPPSPSGPRPPLRCPPPPYKASGCP